MNILKMFLKVLFVAILFGPFFIGCGKKESAKRSLTQLVLQKPMEKLAEQIMGNIYVGDYTITGQVRDSSGAGLTNISLTIEYGTPGQASSTKTTTQITNNFNISRQNCFGMVLTFEKEGYWPCRQDLSHMEDRNPSKINSKWSFSTNISLVLFRKEELKYFPEINKHLTFDGKGGNVLVSTDKGFSFEKIKDFSTLTNYGTTNVCYIISDTDTNGEVAFEIFNYKGGGKARLPKNPRLITTQPTTGFIDQGIDPAPPNMAVNTSHRLKTMTEAPATGYSNVLYLTGQAQVRYVYFVSYLNGKACYGKGEIHAPVADWKGKEIYHLRSCISIYYQPDGSRNVRCNLD